MVLYKKSCGRCLIYFIWIINYKTGITMRIYFLLALEICAITLGENAKILGLFPLPSKSHHIMFEKILKALADNGHEIDIVSHFPLKKPYPRYNDLSLEGTQKIFVNNLTLDDVHGMSFLKTLDFMVIECGVKSCDATLKSPVVQNLKNSKKQYDLIISELFTTDCLLGFGHLFKVPVVLITSSIHLPWGSDRFGIPDNPSYIPTYFVSFPAEMTLYQRIMNTLSLIVSKIYYHVQSMRPNDKLAKEFFGYDLPDLDQLVLNASLLLVNSHYSMNGVRPTLPNFVEVGGLHIDTPKPLPEHLQKLVKTNTKGVIYLSMGSMVMTESFPKEKLQGMFDAFEELPYTVLWKAEKERFPQGLRYPENIHFESWMPQLDILCNPNVKLFISHGGLLGSQEAIYCGVPRLGIPIFADQDLNIKQSEAAGQAIKVDFHDINKESILATARELLENPKYREKCQHVSRIFRDRPSSALDTAIYWIEHVLRHNGGGHLRSPAADLPWYQYYLLDVILIFLFITIAIIWLLALLVNRLRMLLFGTSYKKGKED